MDTFDLELAFYNRLVALSQPDFYTAQPDEIVEEDDLANNRWLRRGWVMTNDPYTAGFGDGVYTRVEGIYQIDLKVPRRTDYALERLKKASDELVNHFFVNKRGVTVTENATSAQTDRDWETFRSI